MTSRSSDITITDQFCGAGGSSIGATQAGGRLRLGLNHWRLAIETHNTNFPDADHDCTDISACDPRRYPSTDILLTSPECTNHSLAKGKTRKWQQQLEMFGSLTIDPAEERSRATMWDVCRFAEHHNYRYIVVENVVDARMWAPWEAWLHAMSLLGYEHQCVYFNSMHAHPTPQSRDRMYVVFWRKGHKAPNLRYNPTAYCAKCDKNVASVQSWKNPKKPWGKYRQQYVYCCPACATVVEPYYYAAANAIDWSLPAPRIGDRPRPLKEKTLRRIKVGLEKFGRRSLLIGNYSPGWARPITQPTGSVTTADHHALLTPPMLIETGFTHAPDDRVRSANDEMPTQTTRQTVGVAVPPMLIDMTRTKGSAIAADTAYPTQTGTELFGLAVPPMLVGMYGPQGQKVAVSADDAVPTLTGTRTWALVTTPGFLSSLNHSDERSRDINEPMPTAMPQGNPVLVKFRGDESAQPIDAALSTLTAGGAHHGVLLPPAFLTSYYGNDKGSPMSDPMPTITTIDRHAIVANPFIVSYYTRLAGQQAAVSSLDDALPTVPGRATHYLAAPGETPAVEDCGFRMLQPHEIQAAMAFPTDYIVLGNQREKVKQLGNAVTPSVMQWLCQRVMEAMQ